MIDEKILVLKAQAIMQKTSSSFFVDMLEMKDIINDEVIESIFT